MKKNFLKILVCPKCKSDLSLAVQKADKEEIVSGTLTCAKCRNTYPIVNSIPRMLLDDFFNDKRQKKTQESFGYQWVQFSKMVVDFKDNFLNYIYPINEKFFQRKLGLDAGCGFGRHIFNAASFGAEMVGLDISLAIESSYENTKHLQNVHLVQGDIYHPPFREETFDFAYSIGVLHHLPDPENGFKSVVSLIKKDGVVFIWVYSKVRKFTNFLLDLVRIVTCHLPHKLLKYVCLFIALVEFCLVIYPYKIISGVFVINKIMEKIYSRRIKLYAKYPFQVCYADWFDRLSAPIRFYYCAEDMQRWLNGLKLKNLSISPTGLYGWRAYGEKK